MNLRSRSAEPTVDPFERRAEVGDQFPTSKSNDGPEPAEAPAESFVKPDAKAPGPKGPCDGCVRDCGTCMFGGADNGSIVNIGVRSNTATQARAGQEAAVNFVQRPLTQSGS